MVVVDRVEALVVQFVQDVERELQVVAVGVGAGHHRRSRQRALGAAQCRQHAADSSPRGEGNGGLARRASRYSVALVVALIGALRLSPRR